MVVLVFIAAYLAFRDDEDLRWVLRTLAFGLVLQTLVALKMRFLDGRFQVHGWFEHQNPMAMWAYLWRAASAVGRARPHDLAARHGHPPLRRWGGRTADSADRIARSPRGVCCRGVGRRRAGGVCAA